MQVERERSWQQYLNAHSVQISEINAKQGKPIAIRSNCPPRPAHQSPAMPILRVPTGWLFKLIQELAVSTGKCKKKTRKK